LRRAGGNFDDSGRFGVASVMPSKFAVWRFEHRRRDSVSHTAGELVWLYDLEVRFMVSVALTDGRLSTPTLGRFVLANETSAVAQLLGISIDQLQHELVGHSLAQVAANQGKSTDDVNKVLLDTADGQVDQAVTLGLMSPDDGANLKSEIATVTHALVQLPLGSTCVSDQ
jgi:hypothetical protein